MNFPTKGEFFLDELYHRNKIGSYQAMVQKVTSASAEVIEKNKAGFKLSQALGFKLDSRLF